MKVFGLLILASLFSMAGCQEYTFIFQPKTERTESILRFTVETPSKADILLVVDNSKSMEEEQEALAAGFGQMLDILAPSDTNYRIGIVSTDAHGFQVDCCGESNPPVSLGGQVSILGAKGNCQSCGCDGVCDTCATCDLEIVLSRPHDGVRGRLLAAYDPKAFSRERHPDLSDENWDLVSALFPSDASQVSAVIDREAIGVQVCAACGCETCDDRKACSQDQQTCMETISASLVTALFKSNLSGLGISGFGWEEGLKSALLSVGIDPEETTDELALAPGTSLLQEGAPNTLVWDDDSWEPWVREDALLAVMVVTDEDDCSMPQFLMDLRHSFEEGHFPEGSICYQEEARDRFLKAERMADLLLASKNNASSRFAYGLIGGVRPSGDLGVEWRKGEATDCASLTNGEATFGCSCLEGADPADHNAWCSLTQDTSGEGPVCSGLAGSRYLEFGSKFKRKSYESVCEEGDDNRFGLALERFAKMATLACFDLDGLKPVGSTGENIQVRRIDRDDPEQILQLLSMTDETSIEKGWYYVPDENKICLSQLNRRLGDYFEIRVVHRDQEDFNQ